MFYYSFWYNYTNTFFLHVILTSKKTPSSTFTPYVALAPASTTDVVPPPNLSSHYYFYVCVMDSGQTGPTLSTYSVPLSFEPVQNATTYFFGNTVDQVTAPYLDPKSYLKKTLRETVGDI